HTLYGAYKYCDEQIAKVYSQDWGIHSVGIRPGVVYGVGRDQGLTSKTTFAVLAAAEGKPYEVPFSGGVSWLYAGEAASAFIHAVSRGRAGAPVFDMNRSEEHTSELQSRSDLVCRLLLEKKKLQTPQFIPLRC